MGEVLYAIVAMRLVGEGRFARWEPMPIEHVHAPTVQQAKIVFWSGIHPSKHARVKVIEAAPAVGFHVLDNHGERLLA